MNLKENMKRFRTKNLSEQTGKIGNTNISVTGNVDSGLDNSPASMDQKYVYLLSAHKKVFLEVLAKTRFHRNPEVWREVQGLKPELDRLLQRVESHMTLKIVNEYRDRILAISKKWTPFVRNAMSDGITHNEFLRNQTRTKVENMMILASNAFDGALGNFIKGEDMFRFEPEMKKSIQMYRKIAAIYTVKPKR